VTHEYQTLFGMPAARGKEYFVEAWRNPSWWNLSIVMPWVLGAIFGLYRWGVNSSVAARERTVSGVITAHDPRNHDRYGYTFIVDGKSYRGWEIPEHAEPIMGQQVIVYYDPVDPTLSALTDFHELKWSFIGLVPLALIGAGTVARLIFVKRRQFEREQMT
jgi:hypothetical protein